jgi:flagellar hook-basal body complex protein FliE
MTAPIGLPPEIGTLLPNTRDVARPDAGNAPSFADRLEEVLESANHRQVEAEQKVESFANGSSDDIHGTMVAMSEADISFRFAANVRNRLIEAYREVMRMSA